MNKPYEKHVSTLNVMKIQNYLISYTIIIYYL